MKTVFLDLGCYDGDSAMPLLETNKILGEPVVKVIGFDPRPDLANRYKELMATYPGCKFVAAAAWVRDGEEQFTIRPKDAPYGSTMMQNKHDWGMGEVVTVKTFDLAEYVRQLAASYDRIIIKIDVEGAEYQLIEHLLNQGVMQFVDKLLVEWHDRKLRPIERYDTWRKDLLRRMDEQEVNHGDWV